MPLINLGGRSFTIACWIKQTKSVKDETAAIYGDWRRPWNFLLSLKNREIIFHRRREGYGESQWWSAGSADVSFDAWTHVVVIWDHKKTAVSILADGLRVGENSFSSEDAFYEPYRESVPDRWWRALGWSSVLWISDGSLCVWLGTVAGTSQQTKRWILLITKNLSDESSYQDGKIE